MSCVPAERRFRLLDGLVGWDPADAAGLQGLDDPNGLRLARISSAGLAPDWLGRLLPPPTLARGCEPCTWYLVTPAPPASRLVVLGPCDDRFHVLDIGIQLEDAVATAVARSLLAIADRATRRVMVVALNEGRIVGEASLIEPVALAFTPDRELVVASAMSDRLSSFDPSGRALASRFPRLPAGRVDRLGFASDCALWVVMRDASGALSAWRAAPNATTFEEGTSAAMVAGFARLPLIRVGRRGFCIDRNAGREAIRELCVSWQGRAIDGASVQSEANRAELETRGQLLTQSIDSGIPRCRWHRIRVDAEIPAGTSVEVAVSASDVEAPAPQGGASPAPWDGFASGTPHPEDWQSVGKASDALIRQPAGRYLFVRVRLSGPGSATPVVRRVHLDLPRATSADFLPVVYRDEPDSADFTERFLALFDATLEELDEAVRRAPALLDIDGVPDKLLAWGAQILGMAIDPDLPPDRRRRLLKAAPGLFRRRGTKAALIEAIRLATDLDAVVEEPGLARVWGALSSAAAATPAGARLGRVRLFGRSEARLRLGASPLGRVQLKSYGNAQSDPHQTGAFRVVVAVPALDAASRERIAQLVEDMVPGHVITNVRTGRSDGFWLLPAVKLAVDTRLLVPRPSVLGTSARLGGTTILAARTRRMPSEEDAEQ